MTDKPFRRLSPLTPVVRSFIVVVAAATTIGRDMLRGDLGPAAIAFGMLLVGGAVYGIASWVRTRFWIEADELRVDTGVVSRQSRRIRIDRLQGIDIVQPFVARLFGLAELRMDVAGGSAREGSLAFLPVAEAHELKDLLLARRDAVRAGTADPADSTTGSDRSEAEAPTRPTAVPDRLLAHVPLSLLLFSIVMSTETVVLVVAVIALVTTSAFTASMGVSIGALPVLGGLVLVQFKQFAGNYRFTVSETQAGLQVRRGLFDLSSQTISLPRLQGVVISEPVLWRVFGWARLDVSIAGYGSSSDNEGPAPSTALPVGDRGLVMWLAQQVLDGVAPEQAALTGPPGRARWVSPFGRHFMAAGATQDVVVSREGWLTRRTHVVPHARSQSLRVTQGPWQRRLGLADFRLDSPPGPVNVRVRHRTADEARFILEQEVRVSREARRTRDARSS